MGKRDIDITELVIDMSEYGYIHECHPPANLNQF